MTAQADRLPVGMALRRRLAQKYAIYLIGAVCVALLAGGSSDIYFSQRELRTQLAALQQDNAVSAAAKIEEFVGRIEQQIGWITSLPPEDDLATLRLEAQRLLRQVPAISHVRLLDDGGKERLFVSRFDIDRLGGGADLSDDAGVRAALAGRAYYGPVYFQNETEPYMTIALPPTRRVGWIIMAEVNLKAVWDVVAPIKIGKLGYAYVVDRQGTLIAHPDISLVLRQMNVGALPQVAASLAGTGADGPEGASIGAIPGVNFSGAKVLSTYVRVPALGWTVLVEQPLAEADAPIYTAILRTVALMLGGLVLAFLVSLTLARRMVRPIAALQQGAEKLAGGGLDHRIQVSSGDELEALADQFNRMATKLQESYADLEQKIDDRTRELAIANRAKTRFLAAASHDLRQPMHALGLLISSLRGKTDPHEVRELVDRADAAIETMGELLDSLLDISKLDAGVVQPSLADFPLNRLLEQLLFDFGPEAQDKGIDLRVVRSRTVVRSDPTMLIRILLNLVSNAVRYTDRGKILVGCRRRGAYARLEVWDTGKGIPRDQQELIFQEFYKIPAPDRDGDRGLGLGLSIVTRLAELLGCKIDMASVPGDGSMFAVMVPLGDRTRAHSFLVPTLGEIGMTLHGRSILVVDDDLLILDAMRRLLVDWGCRVLTAQSGSEALTRLETEAGWPDIIICDYSLQAGQTGLDVLGRLLSASSSGTAGILMTGDTDAELLRLAKAAGYLTLHKPVRPAKLRSVMTHLLTPSLAAADVSQP